MAGRREREKADKMGRGERTGRGKVGGCGEGGGGGEEGEGGARLERFSLYLKKIFLIEGIEP